MEEKTITMTVNGEAYSCSPSGPRSLLQFLREDLGLMGAKNGCGTGHCGTCTVIIDGKAKRACITDISRLHGSVVETIEGLSLSGELHPLQAAFVNCGAVQCGFCTPGLIMASKALLDSNPDPSRGEIKKALKHNICRCTGYKKIIEAVQSAASALREGRRVGLNWDIRGIGTAVIRSDAVEKVQGKPLYTDDFPKAGTLWGELVLSPCAHGEITSIDTREAQEYPGVEAVLTARDIPGTNLVGIITKKQPVLASDKVRYIGDAVALVLADTREAAGEAAAKVKVTCRELPVIMDMREARQRRDVFIHDTGNILSELHITRGDVEKGFAEADVVVKQTITLPAIEHAYLEPDAVQALWNEDGSVTVFTQSQSSFSYREEIAANLALPEDKVRVITRMTGGAFGGREEPTIQVHAALGAMVTKKPVRMVSSRYDVMLRTSKRHAEILEYEYGARYDGRITAFRANILADTGAYPSAGEAVILRSVLFAPGPYEIPNADIYGCAVYTNRTPAGAMRGFGSNQPGAASEILMDMLAEKLEMDPIELRMINALDEGKQTVGGQVVTESTGLMGSLKMMRELLGKEHITLDDGRILGIGIASAMKNVGLGSGMDDSAGASVELCGDTVRLRIASVDSGQGSDTVARQAAAQVLDMNPGDIIVIANDTGETLDAGVTTASRQTVVTGNAVRIASEKFLEKLYAHASQITGLPKEQLYCRDCRIAWKDGEIGFKELLAEAGDLGTSHIYTAPATVPVSQRTDNTLREDEPYRLHFAYCYGTQAAFIAVDPESGEVEVLKVLAVHDAGQVINTHGAEGQIEGGIMMGIGYALSEQFLMDEGGVITKTMKHIGVPDITMTPEMECRTINNSLSFGPFGAKGMGELPMIPTTPAVINAIYDAVGVRITDLPARKDKVLRALKKESENHADE